MIRDRRRIAQLAGTCLLALALARASRAAPLVDPALHFRTLETPHFVIYFHQGEAPIASRLAVIAEDAWRALERPLGVRPPPLTRVLLVDDTEIANGWASPVPRDTILVTAAWPAGSDFVSNTDDWLRLAFTHEFTHIVHLDRSEGWARYVRGIFGRTPVAFPNLYLPVWQIEGLAAYEESVITGGGRLHAGDFQAIVGEQARAGRLEPLDRVNGGLIDWPAGLAPYAYGLGFHAWLADRFGADRLAALADATARRVPYLQSPAFRRIFGEPLGQLWQEYEASATRAAAGAPAPPDPARRITHQGFTVAGPRFLPACDGCVPSIVYTSITPHELPALYEVGLDGSAPRRLVTRYLGSTVGVGRRAIYFDQQEIRRNVGQYSDLYAYDRARGHVTAITHDARLLDPDISPDGTTLVAVHEHDGRRDLVTVPAGGGRVTTVLGSPDWQFNAPRWSPDGRRVVVERHRLGARSDVVVVDPASGGLEVTASSGRGRFITPTWRPDGRAIVLAGAFGDGVFNLYEAPYPMEPGARLKPLTHTTGGALWPDVSPDGASLVFAQYGSGGFDVDVMAYPRAMAGIDDAAPRAVDDSPAEATAAASPSSTDRYRPWTTLAPTSWSPVASWDRRTFRLGAAVGGADVLGYHAYSASTTWLLSSPAGAVRPAGGDPDWQVVYAYERWRPEFWVAASTTTSFFAGPPQANGLASTVTRRERQVEAAVSLPVEHVRVADAVVASIVRSDDDFLLPDGTATLTSAALRAGWTLVSAHTFGYSVSPERGVALGVAAEAIRRSLGASSDATTLTGDARAYLPGLGAHQVLALRVAGGSSTGGDLRRTFLLGGGAGDPNVLDFGSEAFSLLRGFPIDTFAGTHIGVVNADYRVPLTWLQRGVGTWPLFVRSVSGAIVADAGHAWIGAFRARDVKTSLGGEISFDVVAGYWLPFSATVGVAWGHDGAGAAPGGATVYARVGRAF